jgi:hypothetical protein
VASGFEGRVDALREELFNEEADRAKKWLDALAKAVRLAEEAGCLDQTADRVNEFEELRLRSGTPSYEGSIQLRRAASRLRTEVLLVVAGFTEKQIALADETVAALEKENQKRLTQFKNNRHVQIRALESRLHLLDQQKEAIARDSRPFDLGCGCAAYLLAVPLYSVVAVGLSVVDRDPRIRVMVEGVIFSSPFSALAFSLGVIVLSISMIVLPFLAGHIVHSRRERRQVIARQSLVEATARQVRAERDSKTATLQSDLFQIQMQLDKEFTEKTATLHAARERFRRLRAEAENERARNDLP